MDNARSLETLPSEVLLHIFSFIPNRTNLSYVCLDFYDLVCEIEKNKFRLKLTDVSYYFNELQNKKFKSHYQF
jgi:F-box-like